MKFNNEETFEINGQKQFFDKIVKGICITAATYALAKVIELAAYKKTEPADVEYVDEPSPFSIRGKSVSKTPADDYPELMVYSHKLKSIEVFHYGKIHVSQKYIRDYRSISFTNSERPDEWFYGFRTPIETGYELNIVCRIGTDIVYMTYDIDAKYGDDVSKIEIEALDKYREIIGD